MSAEQHDMDAYGEELTRISQHQSEAVTARIAVLEALARAGVSIAQADELVSKLEAGAVAGAHTWVSENSPPHDAEQAFQKGWFRGVRSVASQLLQIADTTAAQRGRAESNALPMATGSAKTLVAARGSAELQAGCVPVPSLDLLAQTEASAPAAPLDAEEVLAAAQRCTWALSDPGNWFLPEASREVLNVALSAVREDERADYVQRLEEFADRHRERLEEMLHAYGPGSTPASHGRYVLVGQPESLIICERMETAPFHLRGRWNGELEDTLLDDLEFVWGPRIRLSR
ncbi:hypothetical protein [Streptomyces lincolnensis]|uniref:hypothetical protein n=1 Tax=Streptomyces lincolnensis TaxID=1915 RepID=UPI0037D58095